MATLFDRLKPTVYRARAIAGKLGARPYRAYLLKTYYNAASDASPLLGDEMTEITEANGQPPRIAEKRGDDVGFGNAAENIFTIGPVTPKFNGGGTDLEELMGSLAKGEVRHIWLVGPKLPDGAAYRITNVNADRPLRYIITAQSEGEALKGF